jgi:hypothetical protein
MNRHIPIIRKRSYSVHHHLDGRRVDNVLESLRDGFLLTQQLCMSLVEVQSHQAILIPRRGKTAVANGLCSGGMNNTMKEILGMSGYTM